MWLLSWDEEAFFENIEDVIKKLEWHSAFYMQARRMMEKNKGMEGYVDACDCLCDAEIENLPFAGILISLETGIRFLTDHLQGDVYFRTKREGHNLDRARTQFKLVELLEQNEPGMKGFVTRLAKARR